MTSADATAEGSHSDAVSVARQICLSQLTRGPRTRAQLAATLEKRLVPVSAAEQVLDRLTEVGLIDDRAFAQAWVESRRSSRGLASRALARELRDRGVATDLVAAAVDPVGPDDDEATARGLVRQRLRSMSGLPAETQIRRLVGFLGRKGYPPGLAYRVVRREVADGQPNGMEEPWPRSEPVIDPDDGLA